MTNPAALMELANRIKEAIDTNMMDGTARRTLHKLVDELRTAASGVGEAVGALDLSMPPKIWLQIDPNSSNEDRNQSVGESAWSEISWCAESIGGLEVVYIRQDLATSPTGAEARDAERLDWLESNDEPAIEGPFPHLFTSERWLVRYRNKTTSRHATIREAIDAALRARDD